VAPIFDNIVSLQYRDIWKCILREKVIRYVCQNSSSFFPAEIFFEPPDVSCTAIYWPTFRFYVGCI